MTNTGEHVAAALAAGGYVILSASHTLCELSGPVLGFLNLLTDVVADLRIMEGKVILQTADGTRSMYRLWNGTVLERIECLPSAHAKYVRPIQPLAPKHTYFGIAPVGKGKWRAVVNTTNPKTHKTHVVTSRYVNDPETAAREHDRIAREYANKGMVGSRVHLNFPAGLVTVAES